MRNRIAWLLIRMAGTIMEGGENMLAVYVAMIHKGIISIDDVPTAGGNRDKVKAALKATGMDQNGNIV
ncbi:hypothetical protein [Paenibacillus xylanexedens]|uniref:hypothetical protein n=1 Tax=Paenibacillus xylanexedens TaxID=528191 RepID=UPI0011A229A4|nr:hypothetical protein [Paenibacillus xylanexedens]